MENNTIKIKSFKYFKRKLKKYSQLFFNLLVVATIIFLGLQNINLKREIQCNKANEFKLFNEVNKIEKDIFGLKVSIVGLEKFKSDKDIKTEKLQTKK